MIEFEKWLEHEYTDCDGWHGPPTDVERIVARHAWDYNGKQATAAQRERLCCGHPAACLEGGSSDPDAQVTMWCSVCVELDRVREEATKAEREKWFRQVNGWMLELRSATKGIPVFDPVGHKLHLIKQDMLFELRAIKEADNDPR